MLRTLHCFILIDVSLKHINAVVRTSLWSRCSSSLLLQLVTWRSVELLWSSSGVCGLCVDLLQLQWRITIVRLLVCVDDNNYNYSNDNDRGGGTVSHTHTHTHKLVSVYAPSCQRETLKHRHSPRPSVLSHTFVFLYFTLTHTHTHSHTHKGRASVFWPLKCHFSVAGLYSLDRREQNFHLERKTRRRRRRRRRSLAGRASRETDGEVDSSVSKCCLLLSLLSPGLFESASVV